VLKGHTPNEAFQEERKHLRPLPKEPFKSSQEDSTISKPLSAIIKLVGMIRVLVAVTKSSKNVVENDGACRSEGLVLWG